MTLNEAVKIARKMLFDSNIFIIDQREAYLVLSDFHKQLDAGRVFHDVSNTTDNINLKRLK